jgi:hypothetical protein
MAKQPMKQVIREKQAIKTVSILDKIRSLEKEIDTVINNFDKYLDDQGKANELINSFIDSATKKLALLSSKIKN